MLFLAASLLLAYSAPSRDTSVHVTYTTRAARASVVIEDLAKLGKVNLQVAPAMENEILIVSVSDVPLSDLMARIATVTGGEWRHDGSTTRLYPSDKTRTREETADRERKLADTKKAIEERIAAENARQEKIAKDPKKTDTGKVDTSDAKGYIAELAKRDASADANALITSLLEGIGAETLSQFEPSQRVVYSSNPTQTQRSLGPDAAPLIEQFIQKHNATAIDAPADFKDFVRGLDAEQAGNWKTSSMLAGKIGPVAKVLLIESQSDFTYSVANDFELRFYDSGGKVVYSMSDMVGVNQQMYPGPDPEDKDKTPIVYCQDSKDLLAATPEGGTGGHLKDELHRKICRPLSYDPLSFIQSDEFLSYAKWKGKPFVADIPDEWEPDLLLGDEQPEETLDALDRMISRGGDVAVIADPTFTVLKPAFPVRSRALRQDRNALEILLQAGEQKGVVSLDDLADFALRSPEPRAGSLGYTYLGLYVPGYQGIAGPPNWSMLQLYGQLSPGQRAALTNHERLAIGSLTREERECVEQLTYGPTASLSLDDNRPPSGDQLPEWVAQPSNAIDETALLEPTEAAPNWLPPAGTIEMQLTKEPAVYPVPGPDTLLSQAMNDLGPDELGLFRALEKLKDAQDSFVNTSTVFSKLRVGSRSTMRFIIRIAPKVVVRQTLRDHDLPKNAPAVSEDNLPTDFQKLIAEKYELFKKLPLDNTTAAKIHP